MPYRNMSYLQFALKEAVRIWPFTLGFGLVGAGAVSFTAGLTEADVKESKYCNPAGHKEH